MASAGLGWTKMLLELKYQRTGKGIVTMCREKDDWRFNWLRQELIVVVV